MEVVKMLFRFKQVIFRVPAVKFPVCFNFLSFFSNSFSTKNPPGKRSSRHPLPSQPAPWMSRWFATPRFVSRRAFPKLLGFHRYCPLSNGISTDKKSLFTLQEEAFVLFRLGKHIGGWLFVWGWGKGVMKNIEKKGKMFVDSGYFWCIPPRSLT